jgi:hypothetical protein
MSYLSEIWTFVWAVFFNWAGLSTGGVVVASFGLWQLLRKHELPREVSRRIGIGLALLFLFFALFNAWRDQYKENQSSRNAGTFVFQSISQTRYRPGVDNDGNVQLWMNFLSTQDKLLTYNIDSFSLKSGAFDSANAKVVNRGGYAYPKMFASYAAAFLPEQDVSAQVGGTLEYKVSYHVEGSKVTHHTEKSMNFDCFYGQPACRYQIRSEHED